MSNTVHDNLMQRSAHTVSMHQQKVNQIISPYGSEDLEPVLQTPLFKDLNA